MGRAPCCNGEHADLKKGPWTHEEDEKLRSFLVLHPNTSWRMVPQKAGLVRCGKSCRLRWMNYLRPDIRRGNFTQEEEDLIIQLHAAVGNKWSVIAAQLPGRTDNEIKNLWNTRLRKVLVLKGINPITHQPLCNPPLSDYLKQCLKSIEQMLIARFATQSPGAASASASASADALCNSPSLSDFPNIPPLQSPAPSVPPAATYEGSDRLAHFLNSNLEPNTNKGSSILDESTASYDNFDCDNFMLGEEDALLPINLSYLNEIVNGTSTNFSQGEAQLPATEAATDLVEYGYWS
ncbi:hypothetical protein Taro_018287 [Colocasia esculenta]|uniref:Uncharacterized protein n=1 Tax=Colocasia esculenta TaxID=4460 RepID=A0A843UIA5_COLES|nr:hypothetical protein [Colocasia esculenta]